MRIGLVVDSGCDLPQEYLEANKFIILPITIHMGSRDVIDKRDPEATKLFYSQHLGEMSDAGTSPYTMEQIRDLFLTRLVIDYDFVFCMTIASSRSPIFDNATKASHAILNDYKPIREKAGVPGPFALRVIDCQNLFAGQGVVAAEAVRQIRSGQTNPNKIRERLEQVAQSTYTYMLPRDLFYIRTRAKKKGDRSVGFMSAFMGTALDIKPLLRCHRNETGPVAKLRHFDEGAQKFFKFVAGRIEKGLMTRTLCFSYGGDLKVMRALPGYADLVKLAQDKGVEVFESTMSITGAINVGEGALAVGFADEPHEVSL